MKAIGTGKKQINRNIWAILILFKTDTIVFKNMFIKKSAVKIGNMFN